MDVSLTLASSTVNGTNLAPVLISSCERVPQEAYQVLLIEHDETLARVLGRVFVRLGFSVYRSDRLPEAAQLTSFDVLVVDVDSVGRPGAMQLAMRASIRMPVLVLTSDQEGLSTGALDTRFQVLEKPCFTAELRNALEQVCPQERTGGSNRAM